MTTSYVNWKGWRHVDFGSVTAEQALYYAAELRKSGINTVAGLRVGELGFGNGEFAGWVRQQGGQWVGREVIGLLQQRARHAGFEGAGMDGSLADAFGHEAFDLMVAFDVLEHLDIDDIRTFLLESKDALKLGGTIVFRVPSGDSPFSGAIFCGDLTHRTLLGSSAVRQIAEEAGLEIHQIRSPVLPVLGVGMLRAARRLLIHLVRSMAFSFIRYFMVGNAGAVVSPNMVVVLRKGKRAYEGPDK